MGTRVSDPGAALDRILALLSDPILLQVGRYWRDKLPGAALPSRASIDPVEIPHLLPYLMLWDVERSPLRFRSRLIGTSIVRLAGRDATGRYLDAIDQDDAIASEFRAVVEAGLPRYQVRRAHWPNTEYTHYGRLLLPLAADGRTVDMIFGAIIAVDSTPAG
ncbi:MAG: PAS domain-containing protein [Alphaproteobacteria bacterium]|nr:PAS domain-containing protein [Alphaproteobacteria bacterium]